MHPKCRDFSNNRINSTKTDYHIVMMSTSITYSKPSFQMTWWGDIAKFTHHNNDEWKVDIGLILLGMRWYGIVAGDDRQLQSLNSHHDTNADDWKAKEAEAASIIWLSCFPEKRHINTCISNPNASAKNISVRAEWLRQSGRAPSEPWETPRWRITPRLASIPGVASHIALWLPIQCFFLLYRSPILKQHSGVVANCDHMSEWVDWVHACVGIATQWVTRQKSLLAFLLH